MLSRASFVNIPCNEHDVWCVMCWCVLLQWCVSVTLHDNYRQMIDISSHCWSVTVSHQHREGFQNLFICLGCVSISISDSVTPVCCIFESRPSPLMTCRILARLRPNLLIGRWPADVVNNKTKKPADEISLTLLHDTSYHFQHNMSILTTCHFKHDIYIDMSLLKLIIHS